LITLKGWRRGAKGGAKGGDEGRGGRGRGRGELDHLALPTLLLSTSWWWIPSSHSEKNKSLNVWEYGRVSICSPGLI
jgi:hypothetical protein